MPFIAIAIAVFADVSAAGAVVAGTLGTFEAIGAVGATISAVGAVTGNKALTTVGLVLGGVGGVGSLASAAGVIDDPSVSSIFGSDATSASMGGDVASGMSASDASQTSNLADSGIPGNEGSVDLGNGASGDFINNISSSTGIDGNPVATPTPTPNATPGTTPAVTATTQTELPTQAASTSDVTGSDTNFGEGGESTLASAQPTQTQTTPPIASLASGTSPGTAPTATPGAAPGAPAIPGISAATTPAAPTTPTNPNSTGGLLNFFKTTGGGLVGMGAIQAVGSFISGALNPLTPAQVALAQSQAAQNNAATSLQQMQNTNLAQPIPTATRGSNANAAPVGLINTPANTNTVTGQVAA